MSFEDLLRQVGAYYGDKVSAHGPTPEGVDWNSAASQRLRFRELLTVCSGADRFSLNDVGCGYGALVDYLAEQRLDVDYRGFDIAPEMLTRARELHPGVSFVDEKDALAPADYAVASGIFNVRLATDVTTWTAYVLDGIADLARLGCRGFAFNMLTSYSDADKMREDLYYGDPCFFFDHVKRNHSRHVALLHDYGLWEFTLVVTAEPR